MFDSKNQNTNLESRNFAPEDTGVKKNLKNEKMKGI